MPRRGPEGVHATEIFPFPIGETPPDQRAYFEIQTWFVFGAGLNWRIMRSKWPAFTKAFRNFDIARVAKFGDADIDRLLSDAGIIRNGKKVVATIANAREMQAIAAEHAGTTPWLRGYRGDGPALIKAVRTRFHHLGETTTRMFLTAVGAIEYQSWEPTARQRAGRR
jgi:3-methyladenine DNA glycosylase Tag